MASKNKSAEVYESWTLIHMPGSHPPILGLSLSVDYDDPDLYKDQGLQRLVNRVTSAVSQVSDDDEPPAIRRELGLI